MSSTVQEEKMKSHIHQAVINTYKIRQAYYRSKFWGERMKFMIAWCNALTAEGLITKSIETYS